MLKDDLKKVFTGEILDNPESLLKFSKDASIFEIKPELVLVPKNSKDIQELVNFVNINPGLSIIPRSAGTDMSGGAIGEGLILDITKNFNKIVGIKENTAIVEPGVFYRDFEVETLKQNLILPSFTASKDLCTLGGMVANNSAGERTLAFGQTAKYVKRLKIILADGNEVEMYPMDKKQLDKKITQKNLEGQIYKNIWELIEENSEVIKQAKPITHKNATGYGIWDVWDGTNFDLTKLIVGSQGTLGIITEIEFELVKTNPHQVLLVIEMGSFKDLDKIIGEILQFEPQAFECFDDQTMQFALRFLSELQEHFKLNNPAEIQKLFFTDKLKNLFGMLPKITLLAQFTGSTEDEALQKANKAQASLNPFKVSTKVLANDKSAEKYWVIRHESFNMLRHHATHMRSAPFIDDIIVKPEYLPEFLPKLNLIIEKYKKSLGPKRFIYTLAGHIGDGNFHIIPLVDLTDEKVRTAIPIISEEVFKLVFAYHGSMSGEHNDGLVRGMYLPEMYGEDIYQIFKKIKEIFDPKGIFNPHKKVDATFKYSYAHLAEN